MNTQQPELAIGSDGTKTWSLNGELHRLDGPAIEDRDGTKYWYQYDKLHREDGPAVEWTDGSKTWRLNGNDIPLSLFTDSSDFVIQCVDFQRFAIIYLIHHS